MQARDGTKLYPVVRSIFGIISAASIFFFSSIGRFVIVGHVHKTEYVTRELAWINNSIPVLVLHALRDPAASDWRMTGVIDLISESETSKSSLSQLREDWPVDATVARYG
jgi:hypothetical protein